jgi:hypothetical protein
MTTANGSTGPELSSGVDEYRFVRWLFLRALGLIYLAAFLSLWIQIRGLVGSHGVLPVGDFLENARQFFDQWHLGLDRYHLVPTLSWFSSSDAVLIGQCAAGTAASLLLTVGLAPPLCLAVLWALYLSLSVAGQDFLSFQWDSLLTEAGFLAMVLAPWQWWDRPSRGAPPSPVAVWLLRWLGFRLLFESGVVKLLSGDPSWRHLTALTFHYQTQPLPTWVGWYASQLPTWWQVASCAAMFAIELGAPWLVFAARRERALGGALIVFLQILILLTGNYAFFNWLTIALCLFWLDDAMLTRLLPVRWRPWVARWAAGPSAAGPWWRPVGATVVAAVVVPISIAQFAAQVDWQPVPLAPARAAGAWLAPLRTVNNYGLFAVMTTTRLEIVIEGSDDRQTWRPYGFPDKPGDLGRRPRFVAPYQPRLDWQMWFAALGTRQSNPWFSGLCVRILEGSPDVLALLATNPFPDHPPRYIRAELYDYRLTTLAERRATGTWWARTPAGEYFPVSSLTR